MQSNIYYITHANTCELAHQLTIREGQLIGLDYDQDELDENGESVYTPQAQAIFDDYVNMIENIMLSHPITTLKEFKTLK